MSEISIGDMYRRIRELEKRVAELETALQAHVAYGSHDPVRYGNIPGNWIYNASLMATARPCPDCAERQPCANAACPMMPKVM